MDLLDKNNKLDLNDPNWKIYTEDATALPQYIGADAVVERAFITQGCVVDGTVMALRLERTLLSETQPARISSSLQNE